jgi:hypothetical protein
MDEYVGRTLTYLNEKGEVARIEETDLASIKRPLIILGEPGMGKTRLLRHLEDVYGWTFRSAASFVAHPEPTKLVATGRRVIIDGLDELAAAQETDPVYRVLGQLIRAGCPSFVLSCRAADWRGAVARQDISEEYPAEPLECTLEPFSETKAAAYLIPLLGEARANDVIAYLVEKGIPDLFGNPLTLKLFAEVAERRTVLPETRGELMKAATDIMWSERSDRRDGSGLASMNEEAALKAAGAACAAYLLTGSEAIALKPSSAGQPRVLYATDLQILPDGDAARVIVGSRLFGLVPGTDDQFKPVHRTVAEFLGARWLAGAASDALARERVLSMMTIDGGVPASLRGLHAWLAQNSAFAPSVIATDPYGVMRYGDSDGLSIGEGRALLHALQALQRSNPFFRSEDWAQHSAKGLTHPELRDEMRAAIVGKETTFHLRSLLLGAIRGSRLAEALANDLRGLVLSKPDTYNFAERHTAALTMAAFGSERVDWSVVLESLVAAGDEDSTRLALEILEEVGYETVTSKFVARSILAYLGLLAPDAGAEMGRSTTIGVLYQLSRELPDTMVSGVLNSIAELLPAGDIDGEYDERAELADTVTLLIVRQLNSAAPDPLELYKWMRITPGRHGYSRENQQRLETYLEGAHRTRRIIQRYAIFEDHIDETVWSRIWRLTEHNSALALSTDDIVHLLTELFASADRSDKAADIWRELASVARRGGADGASITAAARPFTAGDTELVNYLDELHKPLPAPEWQVKQEARRNAESLANAKAREQYRKEFTADIAAVRAGDLKRSYPIAKTFLARFRDVDSKLAPADRIGEWLGSELQEAGLTGLEAVLHRSDLPLPEQVARSYAESRRWNFIYPMIAGVVARVLGGRGLDGIARDVLLSVRIGLDNEHLGERISQSRVEQEIDNYLRGDPAGYERYLRLLLEPALEGRQSHVFGLYNYARSLVDRPLAVRLAIEWLQRFDRLPVPVEIELVDVLANAGELEALRGLANAYVEKGYDSDERRRTWLAVGLLCDFEQTRDRVGTVPAADKDLLWYLRHRFGGGRDERPARGVNPTQLGWIVSEFRGLWAYQDREPGVSSGDTNAWNATDVIRDAINRLASDVSPAATETLTRLIAGAPDGYTNAILFATDQQRRARRELAFPGIPLGRLKDVVAHHPPRTSDDLLAVVQHTLVRVQAELRGNDTDSIVKYWTDGNQPRIEDRCTDALAEDIDRLLPKFGIRRTPQADMPRGKIADLLYSIGDAALPIECKGQWNRDLWTAAGNQLDAFYIRDWRAQDRGIYLVYWFGPAVDGKYRLKPPPGRAPRPETPDQLREALTACIPPSRRGSIRVEVLDCTR